MPFTQYSVKISQSGPNLWYVIGILATFCGTYSFSDRFQGDANVDSLPQNLISMPASSVDSSEDQ